MYFICGPPQVNRTGFAQMESLDKKNCGVYHLSWGMPQDVTSALDAVYRSDWGRIVAALIRLFGDFDAAEEAAQEAFAAAVDQWPESGVPEFPRAWIIQTALHKAIDRLRRQGRCLEQRD